MPGTRTLCAGVQQRVTGSVTLHRATPAVDSVLRDLLQEYIDELSAIFPVARGPDGRFEYDKLPLYWSEPAGHYAFLIKCDEQVAGFALATRGSPASDTVTDLDVAEFFVRREYRRSGVGRQAAIALWNQLPGQWVVRVLEANTAALRFWRAVIDEYSSRRFVEIEWPDHPPGWRVFTFASRARATETRP